jgi:cytochrome c biogenesis protein CcmG/thiol:disulfide interchange protein DsbE
MTPERWGPQRHPSALGPAEPGERTRRRRWLRLGGVVAGVSVLAGILGFGLSRDPGIIASPLLGRPAPDFALPTLDRGGAVRLSDLRGQVVVVNFWASWCRECRVEHPALSLAWDRYRDRGVVFLGIAFQDQPSESRAYAQELVVEWPILTDPGARAAMAFGVFGVPETFVIDREGRVAFRQLGAVSYDDLIHEIDRSLRAD